LTKRCGVKTPLHFNPPPARQNHRQLAASLARLLYFNSYPSPLLRISSLSMSRHVSGQVFNGTPFSLLNSAGLIRSFRIRQPIAPLRLGSAAARPFWLWIPDDGDSDSEVMSITIPK